MGAQLGPPGLAIPLNSVHAQEQASSSFTHSRLVQCRVFWLSGTTWGELPKVRLCSALSHVPRQNCPHQSYEESPPPTPGVAAWPALRSVTLSPTTASSAANLCGVGLHKGSLLPSIFGVAQRDGTACHRLLPRIPPAAALTFPAQDGGE